MRCTAFITLFFALFALFSTMAYAAPVAPQGAMLKRQCSMPECRDAVAPTATPAASADRFTVISTLITQLLALMGNTNNNTPSNDLASTTTVVTASSSSAAPASDPTGVHA